MIKETITYTNVDDEEVTETLSFHLSKTDFLNMLKSGDYEKMQELEEKANAIADRERKAQANGNTITLTDGDQRFFLDIIDVIIRRAYGVRKEVNGVVRFVKSPEITDDFMNSDAYGEFVSQLASDPNKMQAFFEGIFPKELRSQVQDQIGRHEA